MKNIIGVRFRAGGKVYYFDPLELNPEKDVYVVVDTARGLECGQVAITRRPVKDDVVQKSLRPVRRIATEADLVQLKENEKRHDSALAVCQEKINKHRLPMKLVDVEFTFDNNKILFYFTADGRIDFRELVKDLASVFRTRIELRHIGVRDEAKMLGGLGICGRPFCCTSFLSDFHSVSIKMAKEQGLSLNPTKISGTCGRLMCCLKYEQEAYEDLIKRTPHVGQAVRTPDGNGHVTEVQLLTGRLKVQFGDDHSNVKIYQRSDIKPLRREHHNAEQNQ